MNETPQSTEDGKYYWAFVIIQAVMLFAFLGLMDLAPRRSYNARRLVAYSDINDRLKTVLEIFKIDCGRYPTTEEGWKVLTSVPTDTPLTNWHGPYLEPATAPMDPRDRPYVYRCPAVHSTNDFDLYSLGPDGVENSADDIGNLGIPSVPSLLTLATWLRGNKDWLLFIPLSFVAGMIGQLTFPNVRKTAMENRWMDWLWFGIALLAFYVVFLAPSISS